VNKTKRTVGDWWLLALVLVIVVLAGVLGLRTRSNVAGTPYVRHARGRGAVEWPANVKSRIGVTLTELAAEMPPRVDIREGERGEPAEGAEAEKPGEPPKRATIRPVGTVSIRRPDGGATPVPVLTKPQAFEYIRAMKAVLHATPAP
jgi:hypothetical protein